MLLQPTLDRLRGLRLLGLAEALEEQAMMPDVRSLSFEDRLDLLEKPSQQGSMKQPPCS